MQNPTAAIPLLQAFKAGWFQVQDEAAQRMSGRWQVRGSNLELISDAGETLTLEMRLFDAGRLGLDGPGHEQRIYERVADNVIPLRRRGA